MIKYLSVFALTLFAPLVLLTSTVRAAEISGCSITVPTTPVEYGVPFQVSIFITSGTYDYFRLANTSSSFQSVVPINLPGTQTEATGSDQTWQFPAQTLSGTYDFTVTLFQANENTSHGMVGFAQYNNGNGEYSSSSIVDRCNSGQQAVSNPLPPEVNGNDFMSGGVTTYTEGVVTVVRDNLFYVAMILAFFLGVALIISLFRKSVDPSSKYGTDEYFRKMRESNAKADSVRYGHKG